MEPFCPDAGVQVIVTATTPAVFAALTKIRSGAPCRVKNRSRTAGDIGYLLFGKSTDAVPTAGTMLDVGPGDVEMFTIPDGATGVWTLAAANTPNLEFTIGSRGA